MVADQAEPPLGMEPRAVESDDARRLLAAVLQGVQAERGDRGGVGMAENAEHAALLVQAVAVEIDSGVGRARKCASRTCSHSRRPSGAGRRHGLVGTVAGTAGAGDGTAC